MGTEITRFIQRFPSCSVLNFSAIFDKMKNKDGGEYMESYTKHMYCKDIDNIKKELSEILKTLVPVLPQNYNCDTIVQLLQEYYPL